jgi:Helix-turn-helix
MAQDQAGVVTKDPQHEKFVARLEEISVALGSRAALAKAAGLAPTSLQAYFQNSEPTRPVLISLARAANVSVSWLAGGHGPRNVDGIPDGYRLLPFVDLRAAGGHIYPLLGQPTEFQIFKTSDLEKILLHSDLIAVQMPDGFPPYVSDFDTLVINKSERPSIRRGLPLTRVFALREDGIYVIAKQARLKLRQLRWDKVGESLIVLLPGSKSKREMIVTEKTLDFQVFGRVVWRGGPYI